MDRLEAEWSKTSLTLRQPEWTFSAGQLDELADIHRISRKWHDRKIYMNWDTGERIAVSSTGEEGYDDWADGLSGLLDDRFSGIYFQVVDKEEEDLLFDLAGFNTGTSNRKLRNSLRHEIGKFYPISYRKMKRLLSGYPGELQRYEQYVREQDRIRVERWLNALGIREECF